MPPDLEAAIGGLRGGGDPLPASQRGFFEPRFGYRLGDVRIHTDARANQLARALNAQAFTVGHDIAFAEGAYAPDSGQGQHLLAHELTHVIQQTGGAPLVPEQAESPAPSTATPAEPTTAPAQVAPMVARAAAPEKEQGVCPVCGRLAKAPAQTAGSRLSASSAHLPMPSSATPTRTRPACSARAWMILSRSAKACSAASATSPTWAPRASRRWSGGSPLA